MKGIFTRLSIVPEDHLPAMKETLTTLCWYSHEHGNSPSQDSISLEGTRGPLGYEVTHKTLLFGPRATALPSSPL